MKLPPKKMQIIADLKKLIVNHPQFDRAFKQLLGAYQMNLGVGVAEHIICVGQSGTGKSTLTERIKEQVSECKHEGKSVTPILIVNTPALPTVRNIAEEMLMQLGDVRYYMGSTIQKTTRLLYLLKQCEVRMIIFDELQHFIDRGKEKKSQEVADWLKTVIDQSKCSVVLMGLERCEYLFRINEQLRRRFSKRIQLQPFSIDTSECFKEFVGVVYAVLDKANLVHRFDFKDTTLISGIYYATDGVIANIIKLVIGIIELVDLSSSQFIGKDFFETAFVESIWVDGKETLNPFHKKFVWQRLNKPGMPFHRFDSWQKEA